jgi:hypothetical protein
LSGWYCDDDLPVESSDSGFIDHVYIVWYLFVVYATIVPVTLSRPCQA